MRPPRCDGAGYVDEIVITSGAEEIARHRRSYGAGDFVFNPLHYLPLLEQKVGALDQVAPLQGRDLPTEFTTLRRVLEGRLIRKNCCAAENVDHIRYLARLIELELINREARMVERRIKAARFPAIIGKTHLAIGIGLAACQHGIKTCFATAAAIVHELIETRDEKRLLRLQKQLASHELLIIDELGFVPLSKTGAELLFVLISQRYERGATIITSNLPFGEWTGTLGEERLTDALLDRLTHHVHILEMNGQSYRLGQSRSKRKR